MSGSIWLALVVIGGLAVAALLRARAVAKLKPVLVAAAQKHGAEVRTSLLGLPQLFKVSGGRIMRLTPMSASTSAPSGGGPLTCVDFDAPGRAVDVRRFRRAGAGR